MTGSFVANEFSFNMRGQLFARPDRHIRVVFRMYNDKIVTLAHQVAIVKRPQIKLVTVGTARLKIKIARRGDNLVYARISGQRINPAEQRHCAARMCYECGLTQIDIQPVKYRKPISQFRIVLRRKTRSLTTIATAFQFLLEPWQPASIRRTALAVDENRIFSHGVIISRKVWTTYLSYPKSKPKNHLFSGVISVRILWLGMRDSNPRSWDQNPLPYHLANPHWTTRL